MRVALIGAGLAVMVGTAFGGYAVMRGQPTAKAAPVAAPKVAQIPKTESTRLAVLSAQTVEPKAVPAAKAAAGKTVTTGSLQTVKHKASKKGKKSANRAKDASRPVPPRPIPMPKKPKSA
jgi:hypothetical protein